MPRLVVPPNLIGSSQDDVVQASSELFNDVGIRVRDDGVIETRAGDDMVLAAASGDTGYGLVIDGRIALGSGDDGLDGWGSFAGFQVGGIIDAGSGNDRIIGTADSTGFTHNAFGIVAAGNYPTGGLLAINTGNGDDLVRGEAYGVVQGNVSVGINGNAVIDLGNGNDTITGIGINGEGLGYGLVIVGRGMIQGGNGDDLVDGYGTTFGIGPATIDGGNGSDYFRARIIDTGGTEVAGQGGAVDGALILGGRGNDTFDVGYGNATLDGGHGYDTLLLLGSASDYDVVGGSGTYTVMRDSYTLYVSGMERLAFLSDGPWA